MAAYWLFYAFPLSTSLALAWGGAWVWLPCLAAGLAVPLLDQCLGMDEANLGPQAEAQASAAWTTHAALWAYLPWRWTNLLWACHALAHAGPGEPHWWALALALGVVDGGLAINVAHELSHRRKAWAEGVALGLWASVAYLHFHVEHRSGHHVRVATPEDPATARLGQSIWAFLWQSLVGGWRSAWALEVGRLEAQGQGPWGPGNLALWGLAWPCLAAGALALAWGPGAALFFLAQAAIAIFTLESVNYVEHYGLQREALPAGGYAPVDHRHAWNSHRRLTNWLLLQLQRHSDHHMHAGRPAPTAASWAPTSRPPHACGASLPLASGHARRPPAAPWLRPHGAFGLVPALVAPGHGPLGPGLATAFSGPP